ncbi:VIT1/CCC1 transporter family protein [Wenzhouxiangella sediminis]|uniref:VIT family protein n=1 Tax=Wenzhouxiangella sediminis TaxID=1792836 RepID=A0A3E1KB23_9GAMM|nr:VIT family protein [Wenzhouxiangella sediminis]RFF31669.1 VIT family protein [Wenzhouxiangella sediminis]
MSIHEPHRVHRTVWLRAAVMGANDGIVSTSSLIIGVAAASTTHENILLAGVAGLMAGAMSMAAAEYVSVSSQADTERADLEIERRSLRDNPQDELKELADIYRDRGLDDELAHEVARQLMDKDALGAHARDEIGISETTSARPTLAALSSAATFSVGAGLPLAVAWFVPLGMVIPAVAGSCLPLLAALGAIAARTGGASKLKGAARVAFWGTLAMAVTAGVGRLFGVVA